MAVSTRVLMLTKIETEPPGTFRSLFSAKELEKKGEEEEKPTKPKNDTEREDCAPLSPFD